MISASCPWHEAQQRQIACLAKPFDLAELLTTIDRLIK
jgi:hypothetical protein